MQNRVVSIPWTASVSLQMIYYDPQFDISTPEVDAMVQTPIEAVTATRMDGR
jgi:hypothetical protein